MLVGVLASGCRSAGPAALTPRASAAASPSSAALQSRALPAVPDEGLIVDVAGVATFRSLDGRRQVPIPGFQLAGGIVTGSRTWLVAHDGSTWMVDVGSRRLNRSELDYDATDGLSLLRSLPRVERRGHWRFALPGPGGKLLAQWSGECEVPTVYVIDHGSPRLVSPAGQQVNAHARGWTRSGLPVVEFPEASCGQGLHSPGLYVEMSPGSYRLLARTTQDAAYYRLPDRTRRRPRGRG